MVIGGSVRGSLVVGVLAARLSACRPLSWDLEWDAALTWVSGGRLCDYSGMTYAAIEAQGGIQWPYPEGASRGAFVSRIGRSCTAI
jgi:hypothetical protein